MENIKHFIGLIVSYISLVTKGTPSFRENVCWLKVFFVIADICTNNLFQRKIFPKSHYCWCFECFSITWVDIFYTPVFVDFFLRFA